MCIWTKTFRIELLLTGQSMSLGPNEWSDWLWINVTIRYSFCEFYRKNYSFDFAINKCKWSSYGGKSLWSLYYCSGVLNENLIWWWYVNIFINSQGSIYFEITPCYLLDRMREIGYWYFFRNILRKLDFIFWLTK